MRTNIQAAWASHPPLEHAGPLEGSLNFGGSSKKLFLLGSYSGPRPTCAGAPGARGHASTFTAAAFRRPTTRHSRQARPPRAPPVKKPRLTRSPPLHSYPARAPGISCLPPPPSIIRSNAHARTNAWTRPHPRRGFSEPQNGINIMRHLRTLAHPLRYPTPPPSALILHT